MGGQFRPLNLRLRAEKGKNLRWLFGRYEFVFNFFDLLKTRVEGRQERNSLEGNGKNIRFFFRNNFLVLHIACIAKYIEARKRNNKTCER